MKRSLLFLALAIAALPASAQSGAEVLQTWISEWDAAMQRVQSITVDEHVDQELRGPRGAMESEFDARVTFSDRSPQRSVRRASVQGREVEADALHGLHRRFGRAFGRRSGRALGPADLPIRALRNAVVEDASSTERGGEARWQMRIRTGGSDSRLTAEFVRFGRSVRLVRMEQQVSPQDGAQMSRAVTYQRSSGLDLPAEAETTMQSRQQRRMHSYAIEYRATAKYSNPAISRR